MKSDFINIYAGISDKSQKEFKQYLYCFYGNQKQILTTFEEVEAVVATQDEKALLAFRKMTQVKKDEKEHKNKKAKNDYVDLKKWLFEYLALQEIRSGNIEGKFLSLEALQKHKLFDAVEQTSSQISQLLDKTQNHNVWQLFWKMRISDLTYYNVALDGLQDYKPEMTLLMQRLDDFYISAKFKYSAELYNRSKVLQDDYDIILLDEISNLFKNQYQSDIIIPNLYKPLFDLAKDHSREAYQKLKKFLVENPNHDALERHIIIQSLLNYTTARLRKKDNSLIEESFELYEYGLEHTLFYCSKYFIKNTFLNIVNTACQLEKYPWVEGFVEKYGADLHPSEKDDTILLANARIFFKERRFKEVLDIVNKMNYRNLSFKLNVWTLKLRAAYEVEEHPDTLLHANRSFYKFVIMNKEIGNSLRHSVLNFIKMYRLLVKKKSKKQLLKELNTMPNAVLCNDWLQMKIDELPDNPK